MSKSPDVFCGDLADNLLLYKDNYTSYQASPLLELTLDTMACIPMASTPDRAQGSTRSLWPALPAYRNVHPPITSTPRSYGLPTPSFSMANMQNVFSPSPLPVSQVPSLFFPEISPPSQGSGSTPFERQFVGDFEWNNPDTQISPVARRNYKTLFSLSSTFSSTGETPPRADYSPTYQDSQDAVGRVSLINRFISAAADESATAENDIHSSTLYCSSPLSDLSDLTPLSSPESSDRFGRGLDLRSSSPPTSPTAERLNILRQSNIQNNDLSSNPGQRPSPSRSISTRRSSRSQDSDYQPAKGTTGSKRKRTLRSRDGDEIPIRGKKTRFVGTPEPTSTDTNTSLGTLTRRLPTNTPYHPQFSLFYLRFPVSSYLRLADGKFPLLSADSKRMGGIYNEPRDALDLYTPRFVKGCGATKVGVCPICIESPSRGGKGEAIWLSMKFSAYKWHVSDRIFTLLAHVARLTESWFLSVHKHTKLAMRPVTTYSTPTTSQGISSVSARPFSPPVAFRTIERQNPGKNERTSIQEGKCHKCKKWILVESIKDIDIKVNELYWWKHAAACHQGTHMDGDEDFFLDDELYRRVQQTLLP